MKLIYFSSLLFLLTVFYSCNSVPKQESIKTYAEFEAEFISTLTSADTTLVLEKAERFMKGLQNGELKNSLTELVELKGDSIVPISSSKLAEMEKRFQRFPVLKYRLVSYTFSTPGLNDLKFAVEFAPKGANGKAPAISFMLNPVKVAGEWYLCVKDKTQPSKEILHPIHPKTPVSFH